MSNWCLLKDRDETFNNAELEAGLTKSAITADAGALQLIVCDHA